MLRCALHERRSVLPRRRAYSLDCEDIISAQEHQARKSGRPAYHYALILRAARNLLGLTRKELSKLSEVSVPAIARIEMGETTPRASTWRVLLWTLEGFGVIVEDDDPADVCLRFSTNKLSALEDGAGEQPDVTDRRSGSPR